MARDASRAASLAAAQVERVDRAVTDLTERLEKTLNAVQSFMSGPSSGNNGAARVGSNGVNVLLAYSVDGK